MARGRKTKALTKPEEEEVAVPIRWEGLDDLPILFANNILVQHTAMEFIVTFAQVVAPPLRESSPAELRKVKSVPARVVARIGLPPARMQELIEILTRNFDRFLSRLPEESSENQS